MLVSHSAIMIILQNVIALKGMGDCLDMVTSRPVLLRVGAWIRQSLLGARVGNRLHFWNLVRALLAVLPSTCHLVLRGFG